MRIGNDGEKTAMFVKSTLPDWLQRRKEQFHADRRGTLVTLFRDINDALCEDSRIDTYMSGTTAAVVFVWTSSRRLTIAHVGDSRIVAGRRNPDGTMRAEQLTKYDAGRDEAGKVSRRRKKSDGRMIARQGP